MSKRSTNGQSKPSQRQLDLLRSHPEATTIRFGGQEYLFLLSGLGAKMARSRGIDPIPVVFRTIGRIAPVFKDAGFGESTDAKDFNVARILNLLADVVTGELLEDFATLVWWGVITAQPDTELEEIELLLTPGGLRSLFQQVWPKIMGYMQDLTEDDIKANEGVGEETEPAKN